ncbi:MAG: YhjD/YihY/BrkB family envelope integrity protein [Corynebacterium sp.]|nr:YhjD/YihY/BrkB family envelope integrity protein [Corynebacterium sp.]
MPATRKGQQTDEYGIERTHEEEGVVAKLRARWPWFDHVMRMNERYGAEGGNQYAAGITYFSVLSMFPILMLVFATAATVLARRPELLDDVQTYIADSIDGTFGETVNEIIDTAIEQRSVVFGIGGLTALWSGLGWMNNLRYGASKMWRYDVKGDGFVLNKLRDLVAFFSLIIILGITIGFTALGSSGITERVLGYVGLEDIPGIYYISFAVTLIFALLANYLAFFWLLKTLPRGEVPNKAALEAAVIGAIAFEIFKRIGSMFFSNALSNPAGATFGPIIGVMVLFYFIWRILLYCCAWAATIEESLAIAPLEAPAPAVIRVREVPQQQSSRLGVGLAVGAVAGWLLRRKK